MLPKPITANDFEQMQDPDYRLTANGSKLQRKPRQKAEAAPMIILTSERLSKLWNILCGGRLVIEEDSDHGGIICHVSRDSFDSLLEGMIDRL